MTNDRTTQQDAHPTSAAGQPKRRTLLAAALLAAGLTTVGAMAVIGNDAAADGVTTIDNAPVEIPTEFVTWMKVNGHTGLSPASAAPINDDYTTQDLTDWAKQNNMTGLSPASLSPIEAISESVSS